MKTTKNTKKTTAIVYDSDGYMIGQVYTNQRSGWAKYWQDETLDSWPINAIDVKLSRNARALKIGQDRFGALASLDGKVGNY